VYSQDYQSMNKEEKVKYLSEKQELESNINTMRQRFGLFGAIKEQPAVAQAA